MKMDIHSNDIYIMTDEREKKLWKDCIFVFDTSAMLDFYLYPVAARKKIYTEIFSKLKKRLWIPNHVQFEYLKNRGIKIEGPIRQCYDPLKGNLQGIISTLKKTTSVVEEIKNKTKKSDRHPYISQGNISKFERQLNSVIKQAEEFDAKFNTQIAKREKEILALKTKDTILHSFKKYFEVGSEYTFDEIMKITIEGNHRYKYKIPPGYKDQTEKEGTQIFGDLVIWKQILEHSKESGKNIVLISNDVKPDWCHIDPKTKRITAPREELVKEIRDHSGVTFWMYNQEQFMYNAKKLLKFAIAKTQIDSVSKVIAEKNLNEYLIFRCKNCGNDTRIHVDDLNLVFDYQEVEERQMGPEIQHSTSNFFTCSYCGNEIEGRFDLWEYPVRRMTSL